jgi:hypothetical protein
MQDVEKWIYGTYLSLFATIGSFVGSAAVGGDGLGLAMLGLFFIFVFTVCLIKSCEEMSYATPAENAADWYCIKEERAKQREIELQAMETLRRQAELEEIAKREEARLLAEENARIEREKKDNEFTEMLKRCLPKVQEQRFDTSSLDLAFQEWDKVTKKDKKS